MIKLPHFISDIPSSLVLYVIEVLYKKGIYLRIKNERGKLKDPTALELIELLSRGEEPPHPSGHDPAPCNSCFHFDAR